MFVGLANTEKGWYVARDCRTSACISCRWWRRRKSCCRRCRRWPTPSWCVWECPAARVSAKAHSGNIIATNSCSRAVSKASESIRFWCFFCVLSGTKWNKPEQFRTSQNNLEQATMKAISQWKKVSNFASWINHQRSLTYWHKGHDRKAWRKRSFLRTRISRISRISECNAKLVWALPSESEIDTKYQLNKLTFRSDASYACGHKH